MGKNTLYYNDSNHKLFLFLSLNQVLINTSVTRVIIVALALTYIERDRITIEKEGHFSL